MTSTPLSKLLMRIAGRSSLIFEAMENLKKGNCLTFEVNSEVVEVIIETFDKKGIPGDEAHQISVRMPASAYVSGFVAPSLNDLDCSTS